MKAVAREKLDNQKALAVDIGALIARLARTGCDGFLVRQAEGNLGVGLVLRKRVGAFTAKVSSQPTSRCIIQRLVQRATQFEKAE